MAGRIRTAHLNISQSLIAALLFHPPVSPMNSIPFHRGPALPALVIIAILHISSGLGCGPFFRETILETAGYLARTPEFHFMDHFRKRAGAFVAKDDRSERAITLDREMAEMDLIMGDIIPDANERHTWLEDYRTLRRGMLVRGDKSLWRVTADRDKAGWDLDPRVGKRQWPDRLPEEVRLYLDGASHYLEHLTTKQAADLDLARAQWKRVLELPPTKRHYRGTWAAWMLFRTSPAKNVAEERHWLGLVRQLRAEDFADSQHFAEEATAILHRMGPPPGGSPSFQHVTAPDHLRALARRQELGHSRGESDLAGWVTSEFIYSADEVKEICQDESLVEMINLAFIEQAQSFRTQNAPDSIRIRLSGWMDVLEANPPDRSSEFTHLAWAAYSLADFDAARRCLALAPKSDSAANWLRGKIAALDGRLGESRRLLETVAADVSTEAPAPPVVNPSDALPNPLDRRRPTPEERGRGRADQAGGDLAVVQISQSRYVEALETLLATEHWYDAAYVAERLLSPEELLTLARRITPPLADVAGPSEGLTVEEIQDKHVNRAWWDEEPETTEDRFRYLVARKTAREGWFKDARPFFPPPMRDALDHYVEARERGKNRRLSTEERSDALWKASRMHRSLGMAIFGYEIGPDHALFGGAFEFGDLAVTRERGVFAYPWEDLEKISGDEREKRRLNLPATPDERWSNRHYGPGSKPRFHYRYDAAQLAWEAAALRPENDESAARILCIAGTWLKARDAQSADRFYQALVARHAGTELGQKAGELHWFPAIDIDYNDSFPALR